jgi:hypothetical protein
MKLITAFQPCSVLFALAAFAGCAQAVNPVVVQGQEFVDTVTKNRVQIIGVECVGCGSEKHGPAVLTQKLAINLAGSRATTLK